MRGGSLRAALAGALIAVAGCNPSSCDFSMHEDRYTAIVEAVRTQGLGPGEDHAFQLLRLWDPASLTKADAMRPLPGHGVGMVWVRVAKAGPLRVVIETTDRGHAGEDGYGYSEWPLLVSPDDEGRRSADMPGHLDLVLDQINERWWTVSFVGE